MSKILNLRMTFFSVLILFISTAIFFGCAAKKESKESTNVKINYNFPLESIEGDANGGRAITSSQIVNIIVGYDNPTKGNYAKSLPPGTFSTVLQSPIGNTLIYSILYVQGTRTTPENVTQNFLIYYDAQRQYLTGYDALVYLNLLPVYSSPYRTRGTITVKNESGIPVASQKMAVNHSSFKTTPALYTLKTTSEGKFIIDSLIQGQPYLIQALDANNNVLKEAQFRAPFTNSFSMDAQYQVNESYCQALTINTCNIPGCTWYNSSCHAQSNISCSGLTQATCQTNPACFWDLTTNVCIKTYDYSCAGKSASQCTGVCLWKDNICTNMGASSCSSFTDRTTCSPPCVWDPTDALCKNAILSSCSTSVTEPTCMTSAACYWNPATSKCENKLASDCNAYVTEATCSTQNSCFWDRTGLACRNSLAVTCNSYTTQPMCQTNNACMWDYGLGTCLNATAINCSQMITSATCGTATGCVWDYATSYCKNAMSYSCEYYTSSSNCLTSPSCFWDQMTATCKRMLSIDCSTHVTSATCLTDAACSWDYTSVRCINKLNLDCPSKTVMADCQNTPNCFWDGTTNLCINSATVNCSGYYDSVSCLGNSSCTWDNTNAYCKNATSIDCVTYADMALCQTQASCAWDAVNNLCINSSSLNCTQHTLQADCIGQAGCIWTGALCQNGTAIDCSIHVTDATCLTDPSGGCFWHRTTAGSATGSCHNKATYDCSMMGAQSICEEYHACFWHRGENRCKNAYNAFCTGKTNLECDNSRSGCYFSATCKNSITDGGCLSYHGSGNSTACGTAGCTFDASFDYCAPTITAETCSTYDGNQATCQTKSDCYWAYSPLNKCLNKTATCGALSPGQAICEQYQGCYYRTVDATCDNAYNVNCSGLGEANCNYYAPACFYYAGICTKSINTGCLSYHENPAFCMSTNPQYKQGACSYNATNHYCKKDNTLVNCTGLTMATCSTEPSCFFSMTDNTCYEKSTFNCSVKTPKTICENYFACYWDEDSGVCNNAETISCSGLPQGSCETLRSGCFWDGAICQKSLVLGCLSFHKNEGGCVNANLPNPGSCIYNPTTNYCSMNFTAPAACTSYVDTVSCNNSLPCFWSYAAGGCREKTGFDCSVYSSAQTFCEQNLACFWKAGGSPQCQNAYQANCGFGDSVNCNGAAPGCFWDGTVCKRSIDTGCYSFHKNQTGCQGATTFNQGPCSYNVSMLYCKKP